MPQTIPKLISVRQAAELTGKTKYQILYALSKGHISSLHCQKVDGRWVLTEDFVIRKHGVQNDPFLNALSPDFTALRLDKDFTATTERQIKGNPNPTGTKRVVRLHGFEREVSELSTAEVYGLTRVHPATQQRIREGKAVRASVALRLAKGLNIEVERLLK